MKMVNFYTYILGERCYSVTNIIILRELLVFATTVHTHMTQRITTFYIVLKICQFHETTNLFDLSSVLGACYI